MGSELDQSVKSSEMSEPLLLESFVTTDHPRTKPPRLDDLPRSASYTTLSPTGTTDTFSFSEDDLLPSRPTWSISSQLDGPSDPEPSRGSLAPSSLYSRPTDNSSEPKISVSRALLLSRTKSDQQPSGRLSENSRSSSPTRQNQSQRSRALSKTLSHLGRRSKAARTLSRSPEKASSLSKDKDEADMLEPKSAKVASKRRSLQEPETKSKDDKNRENQLSRNKSLLSRRTSKRSSWGFQSNNSPPQAPSPTRRPATPLGKSFSNTSLPTIASANSDGKDIPPLPGTISSDVFKPTSAQVLKKKDELWSVFRALDGDFQK